MLHLFYQFYWLTSDSMVIFVWTKVHSVRCGTTCDLMNMVVCALVWIHNRTIAMLVGCVWVFWEQSGAQSLAWIGNRSDQKSNRVQRLQTPSEQTWGNWCLLVWASSQSCERTWPSVSHLGYGVGRGSRMLAWPRVCRCSARDYVNMRINTQTMRIWECENMRIWEYENVRMWECENMRIWEYENTVHVPEVRRNVANTVPASRSMECGGCSR